MFRRISIFTVCVIALAAFSVTTLGQSNLTAKASTLQPTSAPAVVETDRTRDGLVGPVRRVRTEVAKLSSESGKLLEGKHAVLEVVAYDIKGNKTENQYFPIAGANLTGKEVYKYDDKGNISEMTLLNADGSLMSREVYKYEFDFAGNWNKMTTSVPTNNAVAVNPETKNAPLAAKPTVDNNSASTQKTSLALPGSVNTTDKVSGLGAVELPSSRSNANLQTPVVQLESEPPPPAPAPRPILKPMSGGVLNGTAISLPSPSYPDTARRLRIGGLVSIEVIVDETGKVISAMATGGPPMLREVAVQAALRARFSPTKLSGQPVKVSGVINYKFSLSQ